MKIIIVDIDGTISTIGDRLRHIQKEPKDWDSFFDGMDTDEPILNVIKLVSELSERGYWIVFCTGRPERYRETTIAWLDRHFSQDFMKGATLLMRQDNNHEDDYKIKPELLRNAGIELDEVLCVFEDRTSVVETWRDLGLVCLQVADGDF